MILNSKTSEVIVVSDDNDSKEMNISASREVQSHIIKVLTDYSYKKKIESTIRETVSNSIDSHVQAGKKDEPVYVRLKMNPDTRTWYFESEDKGIGLNKEEFDQYIMGLGESSKRNNPDVLGMFGAGGKAPLSKVNSFDWICRKDGVERKFTIFKTASVPDRTMHYEKPTDEPNGVIVHIDIPRHEYISEWKRAMKEQLSYFPNIVYDVDGESKEWNDYKIFRSEDFEWSEMNTSGSLHISLGGVYYPIDWTAVGKNSWYSIDVPIALKFGLNDGVHPTFSREEIQYDEGSKQAINDKILLVAMWFADRYNKEVKEFDSFIDALPYIGVDKQYVTLEDKRMNITELLKHSNIKVNEPVVKGIEHRIPKFYKDKIHHLFNQYTVVANTDNDSWKKKHFDSISSQLQNKKKVVLLNEAPVGTFKTFLREEYPYNTLFVVKDEYKAKAHYRFYMNTVELVGKSREERKKLKKEWDELAASLTSTFIDGTKLQDSQDYQDWLQERKEQMKKSRASGVRSGNYKALGKEKGDITIMPARKHKYSNSLVFGKETAKIETLHRRKCLTVYFSKDEVMYSATEEKVLELIEIFKGTVQFVRLNPSEIKHVTQIHSFKTFKQFMESKPISRYTTALYINQILNLAPENDELIYKSFPKYGELKKKLNEYMNINIPSRCSSDLQNELLKHAKETNLWDMNIYPELMEFKKVIEDFGFLKFLKLEKTWYNSEEEVRIAKNMAYVMLLHKRKTGKGIDEFELVPKPESVVEELETEIVAD